MFIFILGLISLPFSVFALETDNYLSWDVELLDSTNEVNEYLNGEIKKVLAKSTGTCEEITTEIGNVFKSIHPEKSPVELWLKKRLGIQNLYPEEKEYLKLSIYRNPYRFYVGAFNLSPNIRIGDVYLGSDKLIHFTSTGRRYFNHFIKKMSQGLNFQDAENSAIEFGVLNESTLFGSQLTGVFSFGDLEANYQGLKFYQNLCWTKNSPYLREIKQNKWTLHKTINIMDYINPYFDETFYPSYFVPKNWQKIKSIIKSEYCQKRFDHSVENRFKKYAQFQGKSRSVKHLEDLRIAGDASIPDIATQALEKLCFSKDEFSTSSEGFF